MVVPTRELAIQVADDLRVAAVNMPVKVATLYGGRAYEPQIDALTAGVDIVVGTPGRLLDLAQKRHLNLSAVRALVLDEADKMLDLGFLPDVERIVGLTPSGRQTMLFSATMPGEVVTLARRHMRQPTHIRAEGHDAPTPVPSTRQFVFRTHPMDKIEVLARVLQASGRGLTMVFCQTKRDADQVATALASRGFAVATVHGDLGQGQRERALRAFRSGKVDVLTATEVAARGLDVDDVTHVVNYECPDDEKTYVHRIGRTGRAGQGRCRGHLRRLAGSAPLEAHQRRPEPGPARTRGDVLHLRAPVRRARYSARGDRDAAPVDARPGRPGGRGGGGHRRDRQGPVAARRQDGQWRQDRQWSQDRQCSQHGRQRQPGQVGQPATAATPDQGRPGAGQRTRGNQPQGLLDRSGFTMAG